jgi:hypothetical protein
MVGGSALLCHEGKQSSGALMRLEFSCECVFSEQLDRPAKVPEFRNNCS